MHLETLKIILVDDDEDDRLLFEDAIEELNMNTLLRSFCDGQEFMDHILVKDQEMPHLVFLDLNMPVKNGMQCLTEMRENNKLKYLSVAIYSTSSSERDIEQTFVKGANIYINKPNDFEKLKKAIKKVLKLNWQYQTSNLNRENFLLSI